MENQHNPNPIFQNQGPYSLPNATAVLALGILSILTCCCYGIPSLACGIIGLVLGNKDLRLYHANPTAYTTGSYNNLKAGRICSIVGIVLSVLCLLWFVYLIQLIGPENMSDPERVKEILHQKWGM